MKFIRIFALILALSFCCNFFVFAEQEEPSSEPMATGLLSDFDIRAKAAMLIEETTIVEFAKKREQEILDNARQQRDMLISGAVQYADRIIEEAQQTVSSTLEALNSGFGILQNQAQTELSESLRRLGEARTALEKSAQNASEAG